MGTLISLLLPLLPSAIHVVEALFTAKPKSGAEKMSTVLAVVRQLVDKLTSNGLSGSTTQPTDTDLTTLIETVFQQLKNSGAVPVSTTVTKPVTLKFENGLLVSVT